MSSEWTDVSLEDIADLNGGYAFKSDEYTETGHFVLRTVNITDDGRICQDGAAYVSPASAKKYERFLLKDLDTLFVMVGATLGKTGLVKAEDLPALLNQNMWVVRAKPDRVDPLFLHYAFKVISQPMCSLASGSARGFVKRDDFRQMKVRVPAIGVQRKISELLGTLDDRITLLRETDTTLEAIAQVLFKSWFVDFDPVHAKMQGRAPEGMDEATAALFPDSFEESELGLVPRGWQFSTLGTSFELTMGQSPPGDSYNQSEVGLPFYQGRTDFGFRFPTKRIYCDSPTRFADIGDSLVSVRAPVGDVNIAIERSCIGRGVAAVRHTSGCVGYTYYTMKSLRNQFKNFDSEGTVFGSINKKDFESMPVMVPCQNVLAAFDQVSKSLDGSIEVNEQKIRVLQEIRDTLLPRLISGQLRIEEVKQLEGALS